MKGDVALAQDDEAGETHRGEGHQLGASADLEAALRGELDEQALHQRGIFEPLEGDAGDIDHEVMTVHREQDSRAFRQDSTLLACLDVHYQEDRATAACCLFESWESEASRDYLSCSRGEIPAYQPGAFFRRELPYLLKVLEITPVRPGLILIDGFVWLDGGRPGLGAHLHDALGGTIPVIGVAKTMYRDASHAVEVIRGQSQRPLYVTAVGMDPAEAAARIATMPGMDRLPTMLRRVDRLARRGIPAGRDLNHPAAI